MEKDDNETVADAMNRGMFLAPELIGEGREDPLLEQARRNVAQQAREAAQHPQSLGTPTSDVAPSRPQRAAPSDGSKRSALTIDVRAFSLASGIVSGAGTIFLGWIAALGWGWGKSLLDVLAGLYVGYTASFVGGIIGGVYGFFDGLIGAAILAWLYNRFIAQR
jgi:hypothetical protein